MTRDRAARPDGELVQRRHARLRRPAARGRRRCRAFERLRFTSPHPNDFSDRVIEAMATTGAVCEHVHLPMQSGSSTHAQAHAAPLHARGVSRVRCATARRDSGARAHDGHHRRLPRRDRRGVRGDARAWCARSASPTRTRSSSPRARERRRRGFPEAWTVSDEVASERLARLDRDGARGHARDQPRHARHSGTRCSSRSASRRGERCCRRARATSRRCSSRATRR